jgi:hypothetical protein
MYLGICKMDPLPKKTHVDLKLKMHITDPQGEYNYDCIAHMWEYDLGCIQGFRISFPFSSICHTFVVPLPMEMEAFKWFKAFM